MVLGLEGDGMKRRERKEKKLSGQKIFWISAAPSPTARTLRLQPYRCDMNYERMTPARSFLQLHNC